MNAHTAHSGTHTTTLAFCLLLALALAATTACFLPQHALAADSGADATEDVGTTDTGATDSDADADNADNDTTVANLKCTLIKTSRATSSASRPASQAT